LKISDGITIFSVSLKNVFKNVWELWIHLKPNNYWARYSHGKI